MTTTVVNCKKEQFDFYIGRPSIFGNPFRIGKDGTREAVIAKYIGWFAKRPALMNELWRIKDKRIGCYCHPAACHGDWLAQICDASGGLFGLQGIWDPFAFRPAHVRNEDTCFLFEDGQMRIGGYPYRMRKTWTPPELFTALEDKNMKLSTYLEPAVAWRVLRPEQIETPADHI